MKILLFWFLLIAQVCNIVTKSYLYNTASSVAIDSTHVCVFTIYSDTESTHIFSYVMSYVTKVSVPSNIPTNSAEHQSKISDE